MSDSTIGIYSAPRREDAPLTPASIRERWDRSQRATRRIREVEAAGYLVYAYKFRPVLAAAAVSAR